jgi:hypothetical protein
MRATCPTHLTLLDFITLVIFSEALKLRSYSLCTFLRNVYLTGFDVGAFQIRIYSCIPHHTTNITLLGQMYVSFRQKLNHEE